MQDNSEQLPFLTRIVDVFLRGDVAVLLTLVSLALGAAALYLTPREEEPQIVVPMADVLVRAPGLSAEEVEQQVTRRLEQMLHQIDGVEYVYSMSRPDEAVVTVRFFVGEDREDSLVKLYNKVNANIDQIPVGVAGWVVKPVEVDDVPIVNVTLFSDDPQRYSDHELRRLAEQIKQELQAIPNTNRVEIVGGRPRQVRVELDPLRLAARQTSALEVVRALEASNVQLRSGRFDQQDQELIVDAGVFVRDPAELGGLVVQVAEGRPVHLRDVATILDGPAEPDSYSWIGFGPADATEHGGPYRGELLPAVHVSVAKSKGANAVWVADAVDERMAEVAKDLLPLGVSYRITRDYGETARDKVNELVESLAIAVVTVIGLIGVGLGWRAALVVAVAVPVCYGVTLFINMLAGYTINRVTMFALILALGILVDDPITDVENIARYFALGKYSPREAVLRAVQEVRPALVLSTLAVIAAFLPLVFITGMMGPYMAPMALNVPLTVVVSTFVAFMLTPWMAMVALKKKAPAATTSAGAPASDDVPSGPMYAAARGLLGPILASRTACWSVLAAVVVLLAGAATLPALRLVPLKMLPYDNKNEFQVIIDMPEGTTLDRTDAVARAFAAHLTRTAEVRDLELYVGTASPMDFNGMVRHYFLRRGANMADIRVNLIGKDHRVHQSHEIVLRLRQELAELAEQLGANIKLVEVPPGPPVLATITAEVYGPQHATYAELIDAARMVERRLAREPLVVDVDTSAQSRQRRWVFETDKEKAALSGVSTANIAQTLKLALDGVEATTLHVPTEVDPLAVVLRLPRPARSAVDELAEMYVKGEQGQLVKLGAVGRFRPGPGEGDEFDDQTIYHKNQRRVAYVYGEVAGRPPADAIVDMQLDRAADGTLATPAATLRPAAERTWLAPGGRDPWSLPAGYEVRWAGEGEWKITLDVFRDLGLAFAAALVGIFVILMFETRSRVLPLVIMLAIPLTLIGIMPGFWILNLIVDRPLGGYPNPVFFTATAMIGMIALAGIVVRNSVVLIDFIHHGEAAGLPLREAIIQSVAIRTRPILLTAGTTVLGNWVITLDPIFSGLAWAVIFGLAASTLFTLVVIPVVYWLLYSGRAGHASAAGQV